MFSNNDYFQTLWFKEKDRAARKSEIKHLFYCLWEKKHEKPVKLQLGFDSATLKTVPSSELCCGHFNLLQFLGWKHPNNSFSSPNVIPKTFFFIPNFHRRALFVISKHISSNIPETSQKHPRSHPTLFIAKKISHRQKSSQKKLISSPKLIPKNPYLIAKSHPQKSTSHRQKSSPKIHISSPNVIPKISAMMAHV